MDESLVIGGKPRETLDVLGGEFQLWNVGAVLEVVHGAHGHARREPELWIDESVLLARPGAIHDEAEP